MSDELKPCPFCGGMAEIVEIDEGENAGGSCVGCTTCLASSKVEFEFKENFISNWNRRVQTLAPDAVARLWHAARLGLDMARANDLTKTAETIMEAMNAVECTCNGSDEMCPCQNRRPAPDAVARLVEAARAEADKAMRKYPQPNYVISKVAEEAGEVVKAAIHCAEGRETPEAVIGEIKQAMAMLIRLYIEGDQVHGLPPLAAMETSHDRT